MYFTPRLPLSLGKPRLKCSVTHLPMTAVTSHRPPPHVLTYTLLLPHPCTHTRFLQGQVPDFLHGPHFTHSVAWSLGALFSAPGALCSPGHWPQLWARLPGREFTSPYVKPEQVINILILETDSNNGFFFPPQGCWECKEVIFLVHHTLFNVTSSMAK